MSNLGFSLRITVAQATVGVLIRLIHGLEPQVDQISAKVSGMSAFQSFPIRLLRHLTRSLLCLSAVRIAPGSYNKGTFIKLNRDGPGKGEE